VKSAKLPPRSKRKGTALGRRLVAGLKQALAHARGEIELPKRDIAWISDGSQRHSDAK